MKKVLFLALCTVVVAFAGCTLEPLSPTIKAVEPPALDTSVPLELEQQLFSFESPTLFKSVEVWAETYVEGVRVYESGVLRLELSQQLPQKGLITASRFSPDQTLWTVSVQDAGGGIFLEEPATEQLEILAGKESVRFCMQQTSYAQDEPIPLLMEVFDESKPLENSEEMPLSPETFADYDVVQLVLCQFA